MTGAVLSPALPALRVAFGDGTSAQTWARWALTTPALFVAVGAPLSGLLADRMGRRPVLLGALLLFAGSGSAGALLGSLPAITATRAALGLAAGGIGTTATTLIIDYYDEAQSRILGGQAASASAGVVLAGGLALLLLGWMAVCRLPPGTIQSWPPLGAAERSVEAIGPRRRAPSATHSHISHSTNQQSSHA
jgi:MFS family permease